MFHQRDILTYILTYSLKNIPPPASTPPASVNRTIQHTRSLPDQSRPEPLLLDLIAAPGGGLAAHSTRRCYEVINFCNQCLRLVFVSLSASAGLWLAGEALAGESKLEFNRDIRPILADTCFACHGADSAARQADLRLDDRQAAIDAAAIEPGKPEASAFVERIFSSDPEMQMPPPRSHKVLTGEQKELLKQWVAQGAEYQPHWSFVPPTKPAPPDVRNSSWVRTPIDQFLLARLEAAGLEPAAEADLATLARRASLDLTGLPPTPDQLAELSADSSDRAYENFVERLLDMPEWGEHRGRYWLDYARYADTHGIHFDNYREMWSYRDWVINAFNRNLPYDQFTIEQLAGDLLPDASLDQRIASGFNRCNITTNEGGVIPEEYVVLYARDRTETTSTVFLGLTAGCAVCHDHKFDPLSQREFYALSAFFNNSTQNPMDGNIKDTPPIVPVPMLEDRDKLVAAKTTLQQHEAKLQQLRSELRAPYEQWQKDPAASRTLGWNALPVEGLVTHLPLDEGSGEFLHVVSDGQLQRVALPAVGSWDSGHIAASAWVNTVAASPELADIGDFEKDQSFTLGCWVRVGDNANGALLARMDEAAEFRGWDLWMQNGRIGTHIVSAWPKDALKAVTQSPIPANRWVHIVVTYDGSAKIDGLNIYIDGKLQVKQIEASQLKGSIRTTSPLRLGQRSRTIGPAGVRLQDLRLYNRVIAQTEMDLLRSRSRLLYLRSKLAPRSAEEENELYEQYLALYNADFQQTTAARNATKAQVDQLTARGTIAHVMQEKSDPAMAFILFRGDYDKRRDQVTPATPSILPPFPDDLPRNRLGLAKWLIRAENPLFARVTVNRFWQELYGTGLVRTAGDFGVTGEQPSHPELLDWLASDFRDTGWDVKNFFRQMVTSAAYRQSCAVTPEKLQRDRDNRLVSRGPRFRMDAEMVRDYALAASDLLIRKQGGPSVKPYQPPGVWEAVAMIGSNTRDYREDQGENAYRRSLYTFWKRSAPPASMDIFNAPSREACTVRRERTNTPLQALVTLNDPQFIEAAKKLAASAIELKDAQDEQRLAFICQRVLARDLRAEERQLLLENLQALRAAYQQDKTAAEQLLTVGQLKLPAELDTSESAAWTMLTNEIMNLDEVLNK